MVGGMSVVVNVMLSRMSVMSPPPATLGGEFLYFGCVCFRGELGVHNYDINMFEFIELVFDFVYVDLQ